MSAIVGYVASGMGEQVLQRFALVADG